MKKLIVLLFWTISLNTLGQEINWVTFDELPSLSQKEPKPVMVFIHTDWCKYCLMQEKVTFRDSSVVSQLNENYYCIKLNAESNEKIYFLNRMYTKKGNTHSLSWVLGAQNNELTFPTTVALSPQFQITNRWVGYLSKEQLRVVN
ncbi:MAG: thioredoxin family protein [Flavobacteriales bacterium]|nr:thioredoxin family protein [Flavobacteriales bacterium]|tara:strand:+ start:2166 stop:2600 length:435 start_codon:yes stop_codon:yes gene_type:complete